MRPESQKQNDLVENSGMIRNSTDQQTWQSLGNPIEGLRNASSSSQNRNDNKRSIVTNSAKIE